MKLWPHQVHGAQAIIDNPATMLAYDMGTGKTRCVIEAQEQCNWKRVLVVAPKNVCNVWSQQWTKHATVGADVLVLGSKPVTKRRDMLTRALELHEEAPLIVVVNYDSVWREPLASLIMATHWDALVLDESHRIKAPMGKRSRWIGQLGKKQPRAKRICLTGTPMPHSPLDVFAQYRFLCPETFGWSWVRFRSRYAIMNPHIHGHIVDYVNLDELEEKYQKYALRVRKADVLPYLPPVTHETLAVELGKEARRIYNSLETQMVALIEAGEITASNALVKLLRLQQITGGTVNTDDNKRILVSTDKRDRLAELIGDLPTDEPIVVFCRFHGDLNAVHVASEHAKRKCWELSGREKQLEKWQEATGGEVLAVQIQSGGVGIDLTRSNYCCFYSIGFSLGDYEQALARVDRPGQKKPVTYYHLVATNTADEYVYRALRNRKNLVEAVVDSLKRQEVPA